jgi:pimeloyl-ACP methyl ester carboxylesterase
MALATWMTALEELSVKERSVSAAGCKMHYLRGGSGPNLVMLHGLLGTAECWVPSMKILGHESTTYALDAVGVGKSERKSGLNGGLEASADRVASFMRATGIHKADVVATSHGGAVAMMLAIQHPERVRSLILHAPANPYSQLADPLIHFYRTRLGRWFVHRVSAAPRRLQNLALGRMYGNPALIPTGSLDRYIASLRVPGTVDHVLNILEAWSHDMQMLEERISSLLSIPTLLIWGTRDRAVSFESGLRLNREIRGSELQVIPDAGHLPYEEMPEVFSSIVSGFLRRVDRSERVPKSEPGPVLVKGRNTEKTRNSVA